MAVKEEAGGLSGGLHLRSVQTLEASNLRLSIYHSRIHCV